jgi:hypothetical protein
MDNRWHEVYGRAGASPAIVGPFQGVSVARTLNSFAGPAPIEPVPDFYRDVAVIAYPPDTGGSVNG